MDIRIRDAAGGDEPAIVCLIQELGAAVGFESPIGRAWAAVCLSTPGSGILLAESEGLALGLLSYSIRPDLFHAAPSCRIDELVVLESERGKGVGSALVAEVIRRAAALGCVEVSVTVMPDNQDAQRLYRAHGLVDEALYLEAHLS